MAVKTEEHDVRKRESPQNEMFPAERGISLKVRIKFSKTGALRYIGHLDVMRYFQKAIRRTSLAASYSNGFSPHMIMSFAEPLGVGLTSIGEYFDLELDYEPSACPEGSRIAEELNGQMAEGIRVLGIRRIEDGRKNNAMSLVAAAAYTISFKTDLNTGTEELLQGFLKQKEIPAEKKTKSGLKTEDIRPLIFSLEAADVPEEEAEEGFLKSIRLFCSSGSAANLKPDAVMKALGEYAGVVFEPWDIRIRRDEIFAKDEKGDYIPLGDLGESL